MYLGFVQGVSSRTYYDFYVGWLYALNSEKNIHLNNNYVRLHFRTKTRSNKPTFSRKTHVWDENFPLFGYYAARPRVIAQKGAVLFYFAAEA
jgi:hypothetical protein